MPFIDLNPSPTVQPSGQNPAAAPTTSTPSITAAVDPVQPQNDLMSRLRSFTNFTKDDAEDDKSLAPLNETAMTSAPAETKVPEVPTVQEFAGPDFPTQQDEELAEPQVSLDQKIAQVNTNLQGLVAETPAPASFTPTTPPVDPKPEVKISETDNDVSDDIVIGTESAPSDASPVSEPVVEQTPVVTETPMVTETEVQPPMPEAAEMETTLPAPAENVNASPVEPVAETDAPVMPSAPVMPMPVLEPVAEPVVEAPVQTEPVAESPIVETQAPTVDAPEGLVPLSADTSINQSLSGNQLQVKQYNLDEILKQAVTKGASDVHLNSGYRAIARIDGDLSPLQSQVLDDDLIKEMLIPVITHKGLSSLDGITDLDIAYALPDKSVRFRVNIYKEKESFAAVFRLIPEKIRNIEELNLPSILRQFIDMEQGLVLVTGATGSGKSTTIAALVNEINQAYPKHIVTVEDPIEYIYPSGKAIVSQRNVAEDTKTWEDALRAVLRQDPNVVVIGEMRDLETISAAMTVAETGHLVFATLHTNSASQSVDRIIDVFPEFQQNQIRTQLANVLTAVVCQKLLPVSGGGRRVAVEIMLANSAVRAAIREHKVYQIDNMIQTSADIGMISMEKSLFQLVKDGLISPEVATQYANKPGDLLTLLK